MDRSQALTVAARVDAVLGAYTASLGRDYVAYRNHACRVAAFCLALAPSTPDRDEKVAVAAACHDLGIWTDETFDYLEPSIAIARAWLAETGRAAWTDEIAAMIRDHHKVTRCRQGSLVEAFRRADWVDVSVGLRAFGLPRSLIRATFAAFPAERFHWRLVQLAVARVRSHPRDPLPMVRW